MVPEIRCVYLHFKSGKEGNRGVISSKVGEVGTYSFNPTGTEPAATVLPKDNRLKSKLSSLPKDSGLKPK